MCGIFGLIRNQYAEHPERATAVLNELGKCSVERGRDSAGIAYIPFGAGREITPATRNDVAHPHIYFPNGVRIIKGAGTFDNLWNDKRDTGFAANSAAMIGHTRAATQGSKHKLENMSPLLTGTLVGTHNGDVSKETLPFNSTVGQTDTERLYMALAQYNNNTDKIIETLQDAHGRVALAWYDRKFPYRINLARGGLSPMVIAFDAEGNMYWASSPQWFRDIDEKFDGKIGFTDITIVPEGTIMSASWETGVPVIKHLGSFKSTVRVSDTILGDNIVLRGWNMEDRAKNNKMSTHVISEDTGSYGWDAYPDSFSGYPRVKNSSL